MPLSLLVKDLIADPVQHSSTSDHSIAPSQPLAECATDSLLKRSRAFQRPKLRLPSMVDRSLARSTSLRLLSEARRDAWRAYRPPIGAVREKRVRTSTRPRHSL